MTIKIKVYSDFVCPYCFLAETLIRNAAEEKNIEAEWIPFELHPHPSKQMETKAMKEIWNSSILPLAEALDKTIKLPELQAFPYTHLAHQGFLYAKDQGKEKQYLQYVFQGFFVLGKDIGEEKVLAELAEKAGLEKEAFLEALKSEEYRKELENIREEAVKENITAVPTIIVGDRVLKGFSSQAAIEKAIRCTIRDQKMQFCDGDECY